MNGATALHTRAPCDECGNVPATREGVGGAIFCNTCDGANDDALGALLRGILAGRPPCSLCNTKPARLRVNGKLVCSECSSFAVATPGENVTAAAESTPGPKLRTAAAVTSNFDPEFEHLVSALEVQGWGSPRMNATTLRVVAASDSAENSKSSSVAGA
jgi:hypothetical protein